MKVSELFDRLYFHDSLMENIIVEESKLTFDIDLCWWMQKEYKSNDEEIKRIKIVFESISDLIFECESIDVDSDTIFSFLIEEEEYSNVHPLIEVVLGESDDIKVIRFRAENVNLYWE